MGQRAPMQMKRARSRGKKGPGAPLIIKEILLLVNGQAQAAMKPGGQVNPEDMQIYTNTCRR